MPKHVIFYIISRRSWRKERYAKEKQSSSDKAIPGFPGENCCGDPSHWSIKNPTPAKLTMKRPKCNWSGCPCPLQGLINLKTKEDVWKIITYSLFGIFALPCVQSLLLEKQFVRPVCWILEKKTTVDENGECVGSAKVTVEGPWWHQVHSRSRSRADTEPSETNCN